MTPLFDRLVVGTLPLVPRALVKRVASRYVAGETLDDALATVRALAAEGAMATLDILGESVTRKEQTEATRDHYLDVIDAIASSGLDANISVKATAVGLAIDPALALRNCTEICARAAAHGMFVRVDMEDSPYTESTLRLALELKAKFPAVGVAIQAYLKRSLGDLDRLIAARMNVRICKGIYVEPRAIAWKERATIVDSFSALVDKHLVRGLLRRHRDARRGLRAARARHDRPPLSLYPTATSSRCSSASIRFSGGACSTPATGCACTFRSEETGTPTRPGGSRRTPRSPGT